jgi:predicted TIM-barrel fold metal-dependent hydrolase
MRKGRALLSGAVPLVIDAHVHLVADGFLHDRWWEGIGRLYAARRAARGKPIDGSPLEAAKVTARTRFFDPDGTALLAKMDAAGVDASVLLALDYGLLTGEPATPIIEQNDLVLALAQRHPGRILPVFTIDPRRPGAFEAFRNAADAGMRGLKFHCSAGFYPHDEVCRPFYALAQERRLPILLHTGNQPGPCKARFTTPEHVDDVAAEFPDLTIVCAHLAHAWHEQLLSLASVKPNIAVDFSGWQAAFAREPAHVLAILRRFVDELGAHRVMWGSDGPYLDLVMSLAGWKDGFERVARAAGFTDAELATLLGGAAAAIYGARTEAIAG